MNVLTRYIAQTVITFILLVVLLLLGIQIFIEFTREFPDIGTGYYGIFQVLGYVPLMLPADIYQFFPMAGLLGTIIALGLLASNSELVVMQTSGLSMLQITWIVLRAAIVLTFIMVIIGEVLAPVAERIGTANKMLAISGGQTILTKQGIWIRKDNNYVHIDKILPDNTLSDVTRYQFTNDQKLELASFAKKGIYQNGQWTFLDVSQTNFTDSKVTTTSFNEQEWGFTFKPKLLGLTSIDTDQKSLPEIHSYIKSSRQGGLATGHYEVIFWQRIFQPLSVLVMIMLAVPFVFGPLRTVTMGLRMLAGVITGFGFYIFNQFVGPMSVVYQVPPFLSAILPSLIFGVIAVVMMLRGAKY